MRKALPLVLLVLAGCSNGSQPSTSSVSHSAQPVAPDATWKAHEAPQVGVAFKLPPTWQVESEVNGKIQVKQDPESVKVAKEQFDTIHMAVSATDTLADPTSHRAPMTFELVVTTPKTPPADIQAVVKQAVDDTLADYPSSKAKGDVVQTPAGPAARVEFETTASMGFANQPNKAPEVVSTYTYQYRFLHAGSVYLINVTGPKEQSQAIGDLADKIAQSFSF